MCQQPVHVGAVDDLGDPPHLRLEQVELVDQDLVGGRPAGDAYPPGSCR